MRHTFTELGANAALTNKPIDPLYLTIKVLPTIRA